MPKFLFDLATIIENTFYRFNDKLKSYKKQEYKKSNYDQEQLIHSIEIVTGYNSVYGYHNDKNTLFLKFTIYNPWRIQKLKELLWSGHIMNYRFQSFEAHLTYFMKLYTDWDLYGMDFIKISNFKFRKDGLPTLEKRDKFRMTLYPENFLHHLTEKPKWYYNDYDFCNFDPDLKVFDYKTIKEQFKVEDEDIYSPYKKMTRWQLEVDVEVIQ